ncbi:AAA family ATPase [Psychrobacillus soli]|uniref:Chromosome segregation protein SMC n=1 Tax=Psychrobacillus soli TaxID=1543965 RepID=A0A544TJ58_9BACI|nr:AAA family ATPase [Psychrobacillus soli]TQR17484.1 chromosome segregation protein SMC [Psychrobacillus soli]
MIPWRLQFSGVRDYGATEMNLENEDDHVLITGPNGAGKSTISFCMGAVLRSSKVDIEGLKSQNLPEDQTWRAAIHFLFKNDGPSRIDGPLYVEFSLYCEQTPKQPLKLRYEIRDGDELENLELRQAYRSGDAQKNNFTAYRRVLQYKYKIHPDLYYLIWYQQEVNQFAVMAPEERFRIFSEMHGIDKIQKDWETSLESVKDAQDNLATATIQQKGYEFQLSLARSEKERYEENKRRLNENGYQYAFTTHLLQLNADNERIEMEAYIEAREMELEVLAEKAESNSVQFEKENIEKEQLQQQNTAKEQQHQQLEQQLVDKEKDAKELEAEVSARSNELSELTEAYRKLPYPEQETKEKWMHAQKQVIHLKEKEQALDTKIEHTEAELNDNMRSQSKIEASIELWEERSKGALKLITRYISSYELNAKLISLKLSLQSWGNQRDEKAKLLRVYEEELEMLERNQIESPRQKEAIRQLKKQNIQAYPLRRFIRLMDNVSMDKERLFDAIKYTIFYNASKCQPANDLYHVSLKKIIPTRSLTELPTFGLMMREGLSTDEQNQAARVLWWIEQFFTSEQPRIVDGLLVDKQGVRGAQESNVYILSKKALVEQKKILEKQIGILRDKIKELDGKWKKENEKYHFWNADVQKVVEAEAFLSTKGEQEYRIEQLENLRSTYQQLKDVKKELKLEAGAVWKEAHSYAEEEKMRQADLLIYEQFGLQTERIQLLQQLENAWKEAKNDILHLRRSIKRLDEELYNLQQLLRKNQRNMDHLEEEINRNEREVLRVSNQKREKVEERIAMANLAMKYKEELDNLRKLVPHLVEKALEDRQKDESKYDLQHRQNQAKVEFTNARNEKDINPNAVENFHTLEQEVTRKKDELEAAKNLLEENEDRAMQNEQRLETAIAMQVQKINLLFEQYMGLFQFEGQINYQKLTDKKGRPVFKLFIHVRKEGHRGKLEDVSLKARGGRVGKGVSGGEESLSSLLFALALLQNLENRAGFIVLDEFDSALDESRKAKVFELYAEELGRKLIILSPKGHEDDYYNRFSKAFVVTHDPIELKSKVRGLAMKKNVHS